jgi:hypothetical protein
MKSAAWILALTVVVLLSYWKIVFTKQFTILWQWEMLSQYYTWDSFVATYIQRGIVPMWDPFRYAGNTFIGEMQTGLFYPFKLALYLAPLDSNGLLSERAFNLFYVFSHWLAAFSMFLLVRYLKLGRFPALVAGICFGLGGFVQWTAWSNILDAMPWLPLVVIFLLRALNAPQTTARLINAGVAGLALGMTFLAGSIHIAMMDIIVIATLTAFLYLARHVKCSIASAASTVSVIVLVSLLFGAPQLWPSFEYSALAYRWVGADAPIRSFERIPYPVLGDTAFGPQSLFAFVLGEVDAGKSDMTTYFGVLPLLLAIIGAWKFWRLPFVRYLAALALLVWVYTWGASSFLHGVLYLLPNLEVAREADRFIYVTHFAMAVLLAYGVQYLFEDRRPGEARPLSALLSIVKWATLAFAALLVLASLGLKISVTEKTYLSFFFLAAAYALLFFLQRATKFEGAQAVLVFLIAWDLYSFNWIIQSRTEKQKSNSDALAHLVYDRKLADFIKAQPGMPRVHFDTQGSPNIGDAYGVPITWAMSASLLVDFTNGYGTDRQRDLLGVRYIARPRDMKQSGPTVYADDRWNVVENPNALPRAWMVHQVEVDPSDKWPSERLLNPLFDFRRTAVIDRPLEQPIDEMPSAEETVHWTRYEPNLVELEVTAERPGLLVLGEVFYPGWTARVDDAPQTIYRADGLIRAVRVDKGTHRVSLRYEPVSVRWGAVASIVSFVCVFMSVCFYRRISRNAASISDAGSP